MMPETRKSTRKTQRRKRKDQYVVGPGGKI
jgi:hypothetical protein